MRKKLNDKKRIDNIWILDDESVMQKLLTHMLTELGYFCSVSFTSAATALATYHSLNDWPEMDGLEFMRHLAGQHYTGGLILVSGEK
ncbi:hypothetical protein C8R11_10447 [Nitrosomonas aestuarii]|nr:hypothetical protein C8R11_10447 [Nitrosomonas aestuarii]